MPGSAEDARAQSPTARQLAERYAPVAYLRAQSKNCDRDGEAYFPAPVEVVLGNPEVALKRADGESSSHDTIVTMGPTAEDLAGLGREYYLDFPGNPRRPGCTYEADFKRFVAERGARPTTYAHIVVDRTAGRLVLQYWFWYYFNDWNNTHESDWEMVQFVFDATSAEQALDAVPVSVGFSQHGGGELADWDGDKLGIEDGRPVVHPSAGSHGTYFGTDYYIGWGENGTGFGCDDTTSPVRRVPLDVILLPDEAPASGPLAWMGFEGRWGERQPWEFNGPLGPNMAGKWRDPLGAMEHWRSSSLSIPASRSLGPTATGLFCSAVETGSGVLTVFGTRPWLLLIVAFGIVAGLVLLFASQWRALGAALDIYRRHLRTFAAIGVWAIPIGIVCNAALFLVREIPPVDWLLRWFNDTSSARLFAATAIGGFQQGAMILVISPPVIQAVRVIRAGGQPRVRQCFSDGYRQFLPLMTGFLLVLASAGLLVLVVLGIPVAIWLIVRWQFYGQAAILDRAPNGWRAVRTSAAAVDGRWWQALGQALLFQLLIVLPGPLIGLALLLGGKSTVQLSNSISSFIYAITMPAAVIGLTLTYERFRAALRA